MVVFVPLLRNSRSSDIDVQATKDGKTILIDVKEDVQFRANKAESRTSSANKLKAIADANGPDSEAVWVLLKDKEIRSIDLRRLKDSVCGIIKLTYAQGEDLCK